MVQTSPFASIQAGSTLLAAALRDPAPIVSDELLWAFIQVTDAFLAELSEADRKDEPYLILMSKKQGIDHSFFCDITPIPERDTFRFGPDLIEAFAAYAEQVAVVIAALLEQHAAPSRFAERLQRFEHIMDDLTQEIAEVPPQRHEVRDALAAFEACRFQQGRSPATSQSGRGKHAT